jgi:hypothetical protein
MEFIPLNTKPINCRCVIIRPEPFRLEKFWESIKQTRGIKGSVLPEGDITIYIPVGDKMAPFKHSLAQKWTLGLVLKKILEDTIMVGKYHAAMHPEHYPNKSPKPDGSDFYFGKSIMKFNVDAMNIYVSYVSD